MFIFDILIFIIVLSIVVFVHEFGHFLAARIAGVKVEEFGIGFPPKIWKKKIKETEYFIGALPFGGYTKIFGMDENDPDKDKDPQAYENKGRWAKALICLGGVIMNLLFAVVLFYFLVIGSGFKMSQTLILDNYKFPFGTQTTHPVIVEVLNNTAAQAAGLKNRDVILAIDGKNISTPEDLTAAISNKANQTASFEIKENINGPVKNVNIVLGSLANDSSKASLGVAMSTMSYLEYNSVADRIFCGFEHTYNFTDYSVTALVSLFGSAITEKSVEPLATSLSGPVGIYAVTKVVSQEGLIPLINLVALLSIALGVSNLIPIPAMDGAKTLFLGLEAINAKIFTKERLMKVEQGGMIFLIILALVIVFKDFFQFKDIIFK
jgi:regulator of sigma E protease